jgi:hypothetical protein
LAQAHDTLGRSREVWQVEHDFPRLRGGDSGGSMFLNEIGLTPDRV